MRHLVLTALALVLVACPGWNAHVIAEEAAAAPTNRPAATRQWTVDGVPREVTLYVPDSAKTQPTPVVFAFHGHGGTAEKFARTLKLHEVWPEAIVVYPQG